MEVDTNSIRTNVAIQRNASARAIKRGLETLAGTLHGITADCEINDVEISELAKWLDFHVNLRGIAPFSEVWQRINCVIEDGMVTSDEREDLEEWLAEYLDSRSQVFLDADMASQRLHGFLQGLAIDQVVSEREIRDLKDWLLDYSFFKDVWPFSDAWQLVDSILKDGIICERDREAMLVFCKEFSEEFKPLPQDNAELASARFSGGSPTLRSIQYVLDDIPNIEFQGKTFCVTGTSKFYKRREWHEILSSRGGHVTENVVKKLDYLVLCEISTPAWQFSTYGRKIEAARMQRESKGFPLIVSEEAVFRLIGEIK